MVLDITDFIRNYISSFEWTGKEGYSAGYYYPYKDSAGIDTIGIGHKVTDYSSSPLTSEQVYKLFETDLQSRLVVIRKLISPEIYAELSEKQVAAVLSWYFNTGRASSFFWNYINEKNYKALSTFWTENYISSNGLQLAGLLSRRQSERDLFFFEENKKKTVSTVLILGALITLVVLSYFLTRNLKNA